MSGERATLRSTLELVIGFVLVAGGIAVGMYTSDAEVKDVTHYAAIVVPILVGVVSLVRGVSNLGDYRSFVAWRYLLMNPVRVSPNIKWLILAGCFAQWGVLQLLGAPWVVVLATSRYTAVCALIPSAAVLVVIAVGVLRYAKAALWLFCFGLALAAVSLLVLYFTATSDNPFSSDPDSTRTILQITNITALAGLGLAGIAAFFGALRSYFTFFTTVPIGGVWIGTAALVCVLSVMSGFETDLRTKILGSNAHIQVTKEDGDFTEWHKVKQQLDAIPGVVASTPFAVSEVVIAANNNGMNVIIKGIDPATVGNVTDLVSNIEPPGNATEQAEVLRRLRPIVDDGRDLTVPQTPPARPSSVDPAPADMPRGGDPIDFSKGSAAPPPTEAPILDLPPVPKADPPPPDLLTTDAPPQDYSTRRDQPIQVVDLDSPSLLRRTQSLPGILVGRELVKQTHLFNGEEVRVVSPLSDPSNPDATGTPIPFNRDYRDRRHLLHRHVRVRPQVRLRDARFARRVPRSRRRRSTASRSGSTSPDDDRPVREDDRRHCSARSYRVQSTGRSSTARCSAALKLEKIAMFLVLGIVILVASFSIVGNLIMVVVEKAARDRSASRRSAPRDSGHHDICSRSRAS